MKTLLLRISFTALGFAFLIACSPKKNDEHAQHQPADNTTVADTVKKSIPKEVHTNIGNAHVTIKYHAPAVRGRVIWGGLVAYDQVWVTGAHSATSIETSGDLMLAGKHLPAGKYAIFTIPGKETWEFIVNKNWEQHLADEYAAAEDVFRITVTPKEAAHRERLTYDIIDVKVNEASLVVGWEKLELNIPIQSH